MAGHAPKPEGCEACNFETEELEEVRAYARTPGHGPFTPDEEQEWAWLCLVCRSTLAGNVYLYPRQHDDSARVLASTICWGINTILAEIKKGAA